jgi:hypothetical protein
MDFLTLGLTDYSFILSVFFIYSYLFTMKGKLRSALCGLIYNKTLLLNISANSAVNVGRILSLVSSDSRMIGEMARLFYYLF